MKSYNFILHSDDSDANGLRSGRRRERNESAREMGVAARPAGLG
jgi:hypothetical protein